MTNQRMEVNEGKKEQAYQTKATLVLFPKFKKRTNGLRVYTLITPKNKIYPKFYIQITPM